MDAYRLDLKLYFETPDVLPREAAIAVFHRFIQTSAVDELVIDVADYGHVPSGPGVLLIGHEAHYGLDACDGKLGLLYSRKRPLAGTCESRLRHGLGRLFRFARLLEQEPSLDARFALDGWTLRINDRLRAPNNREAWEGISPVLDRVTSDLYEASGAVIEWEGTDAPRLGIRVQAPAIDRSLELGQLLDRLEAPALVAG